MLTTHELQINRLAQGLMAWNAGIAWFEELDDGEKYDVLHTLCLCCDQSHPLLDEVAPAIEYAGLKPTFTPCVMLARANPPEKALWPILGLPSDERLKSFKLILALFAIADRRRRETVCCGQCSHEWHWIDAE